VAQMKDLYTYAEFTGRFVKGHRFIACGKSMLRVGVGKGPTSVGPLSREM
jgi:hypothetical protein